MNNKYAYIQKVIDGDVVFEVYEPLTLDNLNVVLEDEFLVDAEEGHQMVITIVEMSKEEYDAISESNGY